MIAFRFKVIFADLRLQVSSFRYSLNTINSTNQTDWNTQERKENHSIYGHGDKNFEII